MTMAIVLLGGMLMLKAGAGEIAPRRAEISVGVEAGDIRGGDNRALQAAVDYMANLGGGTVRIGRGRYLMRNSLFLRDGAGTATSRKSSPLRGRRRHFPCLLSPHPDFAPQRR